MQALKQGKESAEFNLTVMLSFVRHNRKTVIFWSLAGLLFSVIYLAVAQKEYAAHAQLRMAQLVNINNNSNANTNANTNTNIEEPWGLIQRLRWNSAYSEHVLEQCNLVEVGDMKDYLGGVLKITTVKNVANEVELVVHRSNPELAKQCTESLVEMIKLQQHDLIEERFVGYEERLTQYKRAMQEEEKQLDGFKKLELGNFAFLSKLDKLSWLRTRIDGMQSELLSSQNYPTKLLSAISVSKRPVSPKVGQTLLFGVSLGLLLGLLFAVGRSWRQKAE